MASKEDKFNMKLECKISIDKVTDTGEVERYWHGGEYKLDYPGMDYTQIVATQQALSQFGQVLVDLGWGDVILQGFDPELVKEAKKAAKGKGGKNVGDEE